MARFEIAVPLLSNEMRAAFSNVRVERSANALPLERRARGERWKSYSSLPERIIIGYCVAVFEMRIISYAFVYANASQMPRIGGRSKFGALEEASLGEKFSKNGNYL